MAHLHRVPFVRPQSWLRGIAPLLLVASLPAQIWSEEFNTPGAPDPAVWSYDLGAGGWGNNELQRYTSDPNNVRVQNGHLVITGRRSGGGFTSARIRSQDKLTFQYGTVEARISIPNLQNGLWPAFWTLGNNFSTVGWPDCGEIDVLEMGAGDAIGRGEVNRRVYSTAHWEFNNQRALYGLSRVQPNDLDGSFHIWRMEWTPWAISTFIDGQWIWTIDISNPAGFDGEEFHAPHFFLVNMAIGGDFPGLYSSGAISAPTPAEYRVDYIRIFDNGHTILGGSSLNTNIPATATQRTGAGNLNGNYLCGAPVIGSSMTMALTAFGLPYHSGGVFAYIGAGNLPFGSSTVLVDLASPFVFSLPVRTMAAGTAVWNLPIPNQPAMAGAAFTTQGALLGMDLGLTNAVDLVIGN